MSRRNHILALGLLVAAATTVPAYAQTSSAATNVATDFPVCTKTTISTGDGDLAKQKFIAARQDYEEGNYDSALRRFKDAYNLDCTKPEVLLIVASTYERKGDRQSAIAALETYVQRAPKDSPDIGTTQAKIENLKKQLAAQPPPTATATTAPPSDMQEHTIYPWLLVGAGVVAAAVGVIVLVTAPSLPGTCNPSTIKCTRQPGESDAALEEDKSKAGRSQGQPIGGGITIAGGAAMIIGGVVWHFLEPTGPKEKTGALTPSVAPGFAGLSYRATF